jgi:hypothetical protein
MTWQSEEASSIEIERRYAVMTSPGAAEWPSDCSARRCGRPVAADGLCMRHACAGWQSCVRCRPGRACNRHVAYSMD